jgi:hypothetical protein
MFKYEAITQISKIDYTLFKRKVFFCDIYTLSYAPTAKQIAIQQPLLSNVSVQNDRC